MATVSKHKTLKDRFCKKNILLSAVVCLFTGFTLCFFSPAEMYVSDPAEYLIGVSDALFPILITAAAVSALLFGIVLALLAVNETLSQVAVRLLFGFTLAGYVQMLFLNGRLAKITGDKVRYDITDPFIAVDFFVFYIVLLLPVILYAAKRSKPEGKLSKIPGEKVLPAVSGALILMQTVGIIPGIMSASETMKERYTFSDYYLSYEPILSLSKKNNVIVFLTDRLDGNWMQRTIDEYPEMNDYLEGFTFYRNSVSRYPNTDPSVPQMLSGLDPEEHGGNIADIFWSGNKVLKPLHDNGYNVNIYIDSFMYKSLEDVVSYGCVDNIRSENIEYSLNYFGTDGIVPQQMRFSMIKIMPYIIKPFFYDEVYAGFADRFIIRHTELPVISRVSITSDLLFLNYVKEHGLNADSDKPVFDFVHLNCAHDVSGMFAELYPPAYENDTDEVSNIRSEFEVLNYWFSEMKRLGIFDNSTIIITGDHARQVSFEEAIAEKLDSPLLTGLLIKPAGAELRPLVTDTETEMHNPYFSASVLEYAGLDHSGLGVSYNDVITQDLHIERLFCPLDFGGHNDRPRLPGVYHINGNAADPDNWNYIKQ